MGNKQGHTWLDVVAVASAGLGFLYVLSVALWHGLLWLIGAGIA